ncbi:MAG: D-alanyl-D-alanine carboxypeptidase family protein [Actinomycetota bacterium]
MTSLRARVVTVATVLAIAAAAVNAGAATRSSTPPPTPVPPRGSPSPFPTSLATPSDPTREPIIPAASALLADLDTGQVLYAKDAAVPRPIASVTKIMTALLTLETLPLHHIARVDPRAVFERNDYGASSTLGLRAGERISVENLLYALLLGSANDAAVALAIAVDGSVPAFVAHMNTRARQLGMVHTRFFSASGLDDRGHATPRDLLRLARFTDTNEAFRTITATRFRRIPAPRGRDRVIQNRNALLWLYAGAIGTKTGLTDEAGNCLVASAMREGRRLVAIVLDAPREPFSSAAALLDYGFEGWDQQTLVRAGEPAGTVALRGGSVQVATAADLAALVPARGEDEVSERTILDPAAAFPPAPGEAVAILVVHRGPRVLGRVALVVASVPPAPASSGPWWARAAGAVAGGVIDGIRAIAA